MFQMLLILDLWKTILVLVVSYYYRILLTVRSLVNAFVNKILIVFKFQKWDYFPTPLNVNNAVTMFHERGDRFNGQIKCSRWNGAFA